MITLNTPPQVLSVLGGTTKVAYNKLVLSPIRIDVQQRTIDATVRLYSTADPSMQEISGSLRIQLNSGLLTIEVGQLDFYRQVTLSAGQITTVENISRTAQNSIESGLLTLALLEGVQSAGV